jgi:RNA polymerase sigma-70 factor, ECF subfamily
MQNIDISTISACQRGDREAFHRIYDVYQQRIYKLAYRYVNDSEEASDVTQEIFLRVFTKIGSFRGECSLDTWVYRVAVNTIVSAIRKSKEHETFTEEIIELPDQSAQVELNLESQELVHYIECAISRLPESLKMPFTLVVLERRSYADVANILEININAVRMRVSRARQLLRSILQPYLSEGENI